MAKGFKKHFFGEPKNQWNKNNSQNLGDDYGIHITTTVKGLTITYDGPKQIYATAEIIQDQTYVTTNNETKTPTSPIQTDNTELTNTLGGELSELIMHNFKDNSNQATNFGMHTNHSTGLGYQNKLPNETTSFNASIFGAGTTILLLTYLIGKKAYDSFKK